MSDTLPSQIDHMVNERINGDRRLLNFYYGQQWESRERRVERHLVFKYARVFIDIFNSERLEGEDIIFAQVKKKEVEIEESRTISETILRFVIL